MNDALAEMILLFADADSTTARTAVRSLATAGFQTAIASGLDELIDLEVTEAPAVVLVEDTVPDALGGIRRLRETSGVAIVFISPPWREEVTRALTYGADAVLVKPMTSELLLAQLRSVMSRCCEVAHRSALAAYRNGSLVVDMKARSVHLDGVRVHLSNQEFRLLQVLCMNGGHAVTHNQLLKLAWGSEYQGSGALLRTYIRNLRRRLSDDARKPKFIHTEGQIGYWMDKSWPRDDGVEAASVPAQRREAALV